MFTEYLSTHVTTVLRIIAGLCFAVSIWYGYNENKIDRKMKHGGLNVDLLKRKYDFMFWRYCFLVLTVVIIILSIV